MCRIFHPAPVPSAPDGTPKISKTLPSAVRIATHYRSRGVGEKIVQWAVAEARAKGCALVELLTHSTRVDAQRFYARLGFQPSHVGMTLRF